MGVGHVWPVSSLYASGQSRNLFVSTHILSNMVRKARTMDESSVNIAVSSLKSVGDHGSSSKVV
jgi:hypothetical protein